MNRLSVNREELVPIDLRVKCSGELARQHSLVHHSLEFGSNELERLFAARIEAICPYTSSAAV